MATQVLEGLRTQGGTGEESSETIAGSRLQAKGESGGLETQGWSHPVEAALIWVRSWSQGGDMAGHTSGDGNTPWLFSSLLPFSSYWLNLASSQLTGMLVRAASGVGSK